jgi:hypothetical protein
MERPRRPVTLSRRALEAAAARDSDRPGTRYMTPISQTQRAPTGDDDDVAVSEDDLELTPQSVHSTPRIRLFMENPLHATDVEARRSLPPSQLVLGEIDKETRRALARQAVEAQLLLDHGGGSETAVRSRSTSKRQRSSTVDESEPPQSAQSESQRVKKAAKSSRQLTSLPPSSPSPEVEVEVFNLEDVNIEFSAVINVNNKLKFTQQVSSSSFSLQRLIDDCWGELLEEFALPEWVLLKPRYGVDFATRQGAKEKPTYSLTCKSDEDFERFAKRWWELSRAKPSITFSVSANLDYIATQLPTGGGGIQLVARRQNAPSASQNQRRTIAESAELRRIAGEDIKKQLVDKWMCRVGTCKNVTRPCYFVGDSGHLWLTSTNMLDWIDAAVAEPDVVTVDAPPEAVMTALLAQKEARNIRKSKSKNEKDSNIATTATHPLLIMNFYLGSGGPNTSSLLVGGDQALMPPPSLPSPVANSSPPPAPEDEDNYLLEYFEWLGRRFPTHTNQFTEHARVLQGAGWGWSDMRTMTNDDWKDLGIAKGFVNRIRTQMKIFSKAT